MVRCGVSGVKKDCTCPRSRHRHGTHIAYAHDGCRCTPCLDAALARQREYRKRAALARSAGTSLSVDATGTMRRLRALAALGWTACDLGKRLDGVTGEAVGQIQRRKDRRYVYLATAQRVAALYDELSMTAPSGWIAKRTRAQAAANGWLPPLAYDDDTIDDPAACPNVSTITARAVDEVAVERAMLGDPVKLTKTERAEAVRRLTAAGVGAAQIGARLGTTHRTVQRDRAADRETAA